MYEYTHIYIHTYIHVDACEVLQQYAEKGELEFYSTYSDVWSTIQEILHNDIRSKNMRDVRIFMCDYTCECIITKSILYVCIHVSMHACIYVLCGCGRGV
jgi:hypothetical protein